MQHRFRTDPVDELMEDAESAAPDQHWGHVIGKTDPRRKIRVVGVDQCAAIDAAAAACSNNLSAIGRTEVRSPVFAIQPKRRIQLVANSIVDGKVGADAPCILRVHRIAADVVIDFERSLDR